MTEGTTIHWHEANQIYLMARLALVRDALKRHIARVQSDDAPEIDTKKSERTLQEARLALPAPSAIDMLCEAFALSPFERDVLLLCAGVELDTAFAQLCAAAQGGSQCTFPTFSLALAALPEAHWSALTPVGPLRRRRLIELGMGETLTGAPLRIDERVLHYLAGISHLDMRLQGFVERVSLPGDVPASHRELALRIAHLWSRSQASHALPVMHLCGEDGTAAFAIAALACAELGFQLHMAYAEDIPLGVGDRDALARLWEREAVLSRSALLLDCHRMDAARPIHTFVESMQGILLTAGPDPLRPRKRQVIRMDVNTPSKSEQLHLWREALGHIGPRMDGQLDALATQFSLSAQGIHAAGAQTLASFSPDNDKPLDLILWDACRDQARSQLENLAQRIEPRAAWNDLVLPGPQRRTLREMIAHVKQRGRVYDAWGFAAKGSRGLGISALFAGPSGTGKTMAAEVLADTLRLDLYRIDLSQVVNKYIGETEKNLKRVFDAAEEGGAILFFDEADALFGKRSEVKDSHDRYANIEVSYLLQRMETYRGLSILATNMKTMLDTAFSRRIRFVVQFPFPDASQRAEIWRKIFPSDTPTEGLHVEKLARLNATGGTIRNIALSAAFMAADANEPVRMEHLLRAAHNEYAKMEKAPTEAELRGWV